VTECGKFQNEKLREMYCTSVKILLGWYDQGVWGERGMWHVYGGEQKCLQDFGWKTWRKDSCS